MKGKHAQVKMGETIAILFIFFVLVLFGLIFYFQFQKSGFERQKLEVFGQDSIGKSLQASALPELVCSRSAAESTKVCVDLYKLEYVGDEVENNRNYYFDIFGFGKLWVEQIYPVSTEEWVIYDFPIENYERKVNTPMPVSIYDSVENIYYFGVLNVELYS